MLLNNDFIWFRVLGNVRMLCLQFVVALKFYLKNRYMLFKSRLM